MSNSINRESCDLVLEFAENFKGELHSSNFRIEPNGEPGFEWDNESTGATFAISFTHDNKINYSGISADDEKTYGTVDYDGGEIPKVILDGIAKNFQSRDA